MKKEKGLRFMERKVIVYITTSLKMMCDGNERQRFPGSCEC